MIFVLINFKTPQKKLYHEIMKLYFDRIADSSSSTKCANYYTINFSGSLVEKLRK